MSNHDDGILIYLKSILLSLSHRFDSFAPANMLHDPSLVFYVCCMHADSVRKTKCSHKQMFLSCRMLFHFSFLYLSQNSTKQTTIFQFPYPLHFIISFHRELGRSFHLNANFPAGFNSRLASF